MTPGDCVSFVCLNLPINIEKFFLKFNCYFGVYFLSYLRSCQEWGQMSRLLKPRSSSLRYKITQLHQKLITFQARGTGIYCLCEHHQPTCQDQKPGQSLIGINWIFLRCDVYQTAKRVNKTVYHELLSGWFVCWLVEIQFLILITMRRDKEI